MEFQRKGTTIEDKLCLWILHLPECILRWPHCCPAGDQAALSRDGFLDKHPTQLLQEGANLQSLYSYPYYKEVYEPCADRNPVCYTDDRCTGSTNLRELAAQTENSHQIASIPHEYSRQYHEIFWKWRGCWSNPQSMIKTPTLKIIIDSSVIILRIEFKLTRMDFSRARIQGVVLCVPGWIAKKSRPWIAYSVIKNDIEHIFCTISPLGKILHMIDNLICYS